MRFIKKATRQFHNRLFDIDALPQLTLLGVIIGFFAGGVIILFRLLIEIPLTLFLPEHGENFEGLSKPLHFLVPVIGSIIIALIMHYVPPKYREVSVGNVLERFHNFQGRMSPGNFFVQFFCGALCLISGQSVGREGPAVHIGASTASILGQELKLPNNSLRTLIGCGVAAAIAASFDTPIAGVIFAMEVVLMSYSIVGFIPIIMASVCGAIITRLTFGEAAFFGVADFHMHGLWELPIMVVAGLIIGLFATLYMRLQLTSHQFAHYPIGYRIIAAGLITGSLALIAPEILGLGYDTVSLAIDGQLAINALLLILLTKIIATAFSVGMGMPGGLIGPQIFIGAIIGSVANMLFPDSVSNSGLYVLLGMAAMMGAVINAPLAALMAVLELTYNPSIIFPSLLMVVVACMTTRQLFKCEGIFMEQLAVKGKSLASHPAQQMLSNINVRNVMRTAFIECNTTVELVSIKKHLETNPLWVVLNDGEEKVLLRAADLAIYLTEPELEDEKNIDLLEIPGQRYNLSAIDMRATLYEAQQMIANTQGEALFVTDASLPPEKMIIMGIITNITIENYYRV